MEKLTSIISITFVIATSVYFYGYVYFSEWHLVPSNGRNISIILKNRVVYVNELEKQIYFGNQLVTIAFAIYILTKIIICRIKYKNIK